MASANVLMVSATWGGQINLAVGFDWRFSKEDVTLRNDGSVNPDIRGTIRKDLTASVQFLDPVLLAESDTPASLVIVCQDNAGQAKTYTLSNMVPRGASMSMNRESPPAVHVQEFVCLGTASMPVIS